MVLFLALFYFDHFSLGCDVGGGMLHRIPTTQSITPELQQ